MRRSAGAIRRRIASPFGPFTRCAPVGPFPDPRPDRNPQPNPSPSPSPAPRQQREPDAPRTSSTTFRPSHPRAGGSSAQHRGPRPSRTPPPPPSWQSAPRPKRDAFRPATSQSPHPRPTDHPRPEQNGARVHQRHPRPPTDPRCQPTYSKCPATAATASQPNSEAETVRTYPRVCIRLRPHSLRTPTAQDYEESPRPATATSPHDPITPTHAHSSAGGHRPAHGQWWQRSTHTQLWELQKWARAEPSLEGLVLRPHKRSAESCRPQPLGGWMPQAAWEDMLADALHPLGVHPRNLPAPQDHPYVIGRLRETLQETQRDGIRLWDITQSLSLHTHTPFPPHKCRRTGTGGVHRTP